MKQVVLTPNEDISVSPLSEDELKWIYRLQRTLNACPERLEIVTIGDPGLEIITNEKYSDLSDGQAAIDGVVLATIKGKPKVHGVSG